MTRNAPSAAVAAYLFLCIVLGGSAQGTWGNLALQLLGIALIVFAAISSRGAEGPQRRMKVLYWLLLAGLLVIFLQLIPLPASVWTDLPGRQDLAKGFGLLGFETPPLPVSEAPFDTLLTLFAAIPAIAAFCATDRLRPSPRFLAFAVIAGTVLAVVLGALQVAGGPGSRAYLYPVTNRGAVGFFANQNHMATLLLATIPLTMALIFAKKPEQGSPGRERYSVALILLLLVLFGVALNGSLAGYGLVVPVLLASVVIGPAGMRWRRLAAPIAVLALSAGVLLMVTAPLTDTAEHSGVSGSLTSRVEIWKTSSELIADTFPLGTGLGTFQQVYHQYEDPLTVTNRYVNHAHNDYVEFVSDLGLAGVLLIVGFLIWWTVVTAGIWKSRLSTPFTKASTIVTAAVLIHSVVDFPLRTSAISAIFAASLALMGQRSSTSASSVQSEGSASSRRRKARHVELR